ncbi:dienelactone hydrolase family protein [Shewanella pneumatophori]|uniref:Dienelactone hydrolase family protein n=1 Tax=Shewanella pneumatophori TaxID=314092 RepID=A0A9X1ZK86_9GAMM|nr:dienelactone hydrolase family protein [Shewanella pneumatophori]MCL1137511.1 dienelactone hydrolase family protein [Shewanella pneumatophori]
MKVMIITDIFGVCESSDLLISNINNIDLVHVIDPYAGERNYFANEQQAYRSFIERCGHEDYYLLAEALFHQLEPDLIIGFSAGANVAWRLSGELKAKNKLFRCFYPTRIHQYLAAKPIAKMEVIFPQQEPGFNVNEVEAIISNFDNLELQVTPYQHGFMNKSSQAYDQQGFQFGVDVIAKAIKR